MPISMFLDVSSGAVGGLTDQEAPTRLKTEGPNELPSAQPRADNPIHCTRTGSDPYSASKSPTAWSIAYCISSTTSLGQVTKQTIVAEVDPVPAKDWER